jgi:hypothetical protein
MMEYIREDSTGTGAVRIHDEDGMSNRTSVVSSAEGPSFQEQKERPTIEELEARLRCLGNV